MSFKFPLSALVRTKNSDVPMLVEQQIFYAKSILDDLGDLRANHKEVPITENQYRCGWKDSNRRHQTHVYPESALVLVDEK